MLLASNTSTSLQRTLAAAVQSAAQRLTVPKQRVFEWHVQNSPKPKNAKQVTSKVKSMLIISFDIKGIVHK
jgi:hypothetical protein